MSREITEAVAAQATADSLVPFLLGAAEFDSGTVRMWSGIGNLIWDGETWLGGGSLLGISEISETREIEARGTSITLSGIPSALLSVALAEDYQDRPLKLWLGFLTPESWGDFSSEFGDDFSRRYSGGEVIADPVLLFSGRMDVMEISESGETAQITIGVENRLIDLRKVRERRFTPEDQKSVYPDDKGFDFVPVIQDAPLLWGRSG
ncbi:MAG: hypothetical protein E6R03_01225 [Hyphomicrobiaceae bacterium]|nr:MAG: hypothetical protein E6R03_01225 [Hyphomicrobiaceae bacterium]